MLTLTICLSVLRFQIEGLRLFLSPSTTVRYWTGSYCNTAVAVLLIARSFTRKESSCESNVSSFRLDGWLFSYASRSRTVQHVIEYARGRG